MKMKEQPICPTSGVVITYNHSLKCVIYASDYSISKIESEINNTNVLLYNIVQIIMFLSHVWRTKRKNQANEKT
jgi:hypothetical protein